MLISIIINLFANLIYRLFHVLIHNPNGKGKGNTTIVEGKGSAQSLAQECAELLKKRGMERLMLQDFEFQNRVSKKEIQDLQALQRKLQDMSAELAEYLHLAPISIDVMKGSDDKNAPSAAGDYVSGGRKIDFYVRDYYVEDQLKAILCHEFTHYFMDSNRFDDWSDRALNERRTDVMSSMIGFSKIMIEGYYVITKAKYRVFTWDVQSSSVVGYLNVSENKIVRKQLLKIRKQLNKSIEDKKKTETKKANTSKKNSSQINTDIEALRLDLKHRTEGTRQMLDQVNTIKKRSPSSENVSKMDFQKLQEALFFLENGNDQQILDYCEKASQSGDAEEVQNAQKKLLHLGNELYIIMKFLQ